MIRIGVAQIDNHFEIEKNVSAILLCLKYHAAKNVDLVLFPECAVTGYNSGIMKADATAIQKSVDIIKSHAQELKINIALPTPWPDPDGGFSNSVLLISDRGEIIQSAHKIGLQRGEDRLFKSAPAHPRVFEIKGHKIGVIICVETSHDAWSYLKSEEQAELIFWPGFYAITAEEAAKEWESSESSADQKVRENLLSHWSVPLIHVNCASSPEAQYWPGKLFGGSAAYDESGESIYAGIRSQAEVAVLEFNNGKLSLIEQVSAPFLL